MAETAEGGQVVRLRISAVPPVQMVDFKEGLPTVPSGDVGGCRRQKPTALASAATAMRDGLENIVRDVLECLVERRSSCRQGQVDQNQADQRGRRHGLFKNVGF
jgi:hypothetical protein